jgi:pyruvate/2-oxoglutarate dehydrogenase complex dihydrolipoamide acyltransferase (E2) component
MRIGALAWLGMAALAATMLAVAGERAPAWAEGAIAVGSTGNVKRDGIAFGLASDEPAGTAGEVAVKRCRTFEAKAAAARCQVVASFSGACFAIAYDPEPGTPGAGWGVGPDQLVANQKAVAMCEQAAGAGRKGYCQVERFGCDTGPKLTPKADDADAQKGAAPAAPKSDAPADAPPGAKPTPGDDAEAAPDARNRAKKTTEDNPAAEPKPGAKGTDESKDAKEGEAAKPAAVAEVPPPPAPKPAPELRAKQQTGADRAEPKGRGMTAPLLPVMALAGIGLAYWAGQSLRGRTKGGVSERQILTGSALAVAAAIAVKILDMVGADAALTAILAGLIALGAALLA